MLGAMLGGLEIAIIILVILLIFGPSKLPQLGEGIGKMLRGF
ncbi:MAG TPA: twin-arginine translocase TatA/TatE family subunit, partial [Nannocystis sp.]